MSNWFDPLDTSVTPELWNRMKELRPKQVITLRDPNTGAQFVVMQRDYFVQIAGLSGLGLHDPSDSASEVQK